MNTETAKDVFKLFNDVDIMFAYHDLLCGDMIDEGCSRVVYEHEISPKKLVVKIERNSKFRSATDNIMEWHIWEIVQWLDYDIKKWFAPCVRISNNGRILVQKRTRPLTLKEWDDLKEVPAFFTDVKRSNLGMYNGHVCFHDYAFTAGLQRFDKRMKKITKHDRTRD